MKVGDLVRTRIPRVGVPQGTLGLIVKDYYTVMGDERYVVHMFGIRRPLIKRRCLPTSLEVINESR